MLFSRKLIGVSLTDAMPPVVPGIITSAVVIKGLSAATPLVKAAFKNQFIALAAEMGFSEEEMPALAAAYDRNLLELLPLIMRKAAVSNVIEIESE